MKHLLLANSQKKKKKKLTPQGHNLGESPTKTRQIDRIGLRLNHMTGEGGSALEQKQNMWLKEASHSLYSPLLKAVWTLF